MILNFRFFAPNFFNFKIILGISVSENSFASRFFTLAYCCTMPRRNHVVETWFSHVKEVEYTLSNNLWDYSYDGSWWVHPNVIITNPPKSSTFHFLTTLQTAEGGITITVSLSVNVSDCLVEVNYDWLTRFFVQMRSITPKGLRAASYRKLVRSFSYNQQLGHFQPSEVGVVWLVRQQFLIGISPKWSGEWWYIVELILVEVRLSCTSFSLFTLIFLLFDCHFLRNIISLNFVVSNFLTIVLFIVFIPIFHPVDLYWHYRW